MDGDKLARLRRYHGLTQAEVARAAGVQQSVVSDVERGVRRSPEITAHVLHGLLTCVTPSRVLSQRREAMREVLEASGASNIRLFGSAAVGDDDWRSDIDLLARFDRPMTLSSVYDLTVKLRRLAGGVPVDLVVEDPDTALNDLHTVPL